MRHGRTRGRTDHVAHSAGRLLTKKGGRNMLRYRPTVRRPIAQWSIVASETILVAASAVYLMTGQLSSLIVWIVLTTAYLVGGLLNVWSGDAEHVGDRGEIRFLARWSWVLPIISSGVGFSCAVDALVNQGSGQSAQGGFTLAACVGVVLSWALLQVGFANIYRILDEAADDQALRFPGNKQPARINYPYFAFTVGTSFATSDADVLTAGVRRVVMLHSVISFFYNAIVVAVAFQVLRESIGNA